MRINQKLGDEASDWSRNSHCAEEEKKWIPHPQADQSVIYVLLELDFNQAILLSSKNVCCLWAHSKCSTLKIQTKEGTTRSTVGLSSVAFTCSTVSNYSSAASHACSPSENRTGEYQTASASRLSRSQGEEECFLFLNRFEEAGGIPVPGHGHQSQPSVEVFSPSLDLHTGCPLKRRAAIFFIH